VSWLNVLATVRDTGTDKLSLYEVPHTPIQHMMVKFSLWLAKYHTGVAYWV